jgi:hypothetical protein
MLWVRARRNSAVARRAGIAEVVELEQLRRHRFAAVVALAALGIDAHVKHLRLGHRSISRSSKA